MKREIGVMGIQVGMTDDKHDNLKRDVYKRQVRNRKNSDGKMVQILPADFCSVLCTPGNLYFYCSADELQLKD